MESKKQEENQDLGEHIDMEDEEEFEIANYDGNQEDQEFDNIIGCLQDIVISQEFELLQQQFFKKHYQVFEDTEENKMEYMTIFKQYQQEIESYIEKQLMEMIEGFDIDILLDLLQEREDQIDESLLDLLYSFTDFEKFKAFILDYKKEFEEIERIEKLKTIKQTTKKTLNKANNLGNQKNTGNIFADNSKNKNLFSNKDPLADLKNLKIGDKSKSQKSSNQQEKDFNDIKEEDLQKSFFIHCQGLTPQIQKKKNN